MAGASLLALIDDIAAILDDVALLSKVAAEKTAGVVGDDLALNAHQVSGVAPERELPIVWAVAKGSLVNKAILVPAALIITLIAPWAVLPLLTLGGLYLTYEGVEKLVHSLFGDDAEEIAHDQELLAAVANPEADLAVLEKERIKGAIRTDFILSAEIIIIALGTVSTAPFLQKVVVLTGIAVFMTIFVYGLVGAIVKLDDLGFWLEKKRSALAQRCGAVLIKAAPTLMRTLAVAGTAAMFMVGGGILSHAIPALVLVTGLAEAAAMKVPLIGPALAWVAPLALNCLSGLLAGIATYAVIGLASKIKATLRDRR